MQGWAKNRLLNKRTRSLLAMSASGTPSAALVPARITGDGVRIMKTSN